MITHDRSSDACVFHDLQESSLLGVQHAHSMEMSSPDQHPRGLHPQLRRLRCSRTPKQSSKQPDYPSSQARVVGCHGGSVSGVDALQAFLIRLQCNCKPVWKIEAPAVHSWNLDWRGDNIGDSGTCMRFYVYTEPYPIILCRYAGNLCRAGGSWHTYKKKKTTGLSAQPKKVFSTVPRQA